MKTRQSPEKVDLLHMFQTQGYIHTPDLGVSDDDLLEVRALLQGLFDRYAELPVDVAHDMAATEPNPDRTAPRFPEINNCTVLEPRLLKTPVYAAIESLARRVSGRNSTLVFDHALYKPPGKNAPTSWHQDIAYGPDDGAGIAIWLPLQPTSIEDGCMRYVPITHRGAPLEHAHRVTAENKDLYSIDETQFDVNEAQSVPLPFGGVCGHGRMTIHGAWPNMGHDTRRAWITFFKTEPVGPLSTRLHRKADKVLHRTRPTS